MQENATFNCSNYKALSVLNFVTRDVMMSIRVETGVMWVGELIYVKTSPKSLQSAGESLLGLTNTKSLPPNNQYRRRQAKNTLGNGQFLRRTLEKVSPIPDKCCDPPQ